MSEINIQDQMFANLQHSSCERGEAVPEGSSGNHPTARPGQDGNTLQRVPHGTRLQREGANALHSETRVHRSHGAKQDRLSDSIYINFKNRHQESLRIRARRAATLGSGEAVTRGCDGVPGNSRHSDLLWVLVPGACSVFQL